MNEDSDTGVLTKVGLALDVKAVAARIGRAVGARLDLSLDDRGIYIDYLSGGGGKGRAALQQLAQFADQRGLTISLQALDGDPGLVRYYLRSGYSLDTRGMPLPEWLARQDRLWSAYLATGQGVAELPVADMRRDPDKSY